MDLLNISSSPKEMKTVVMDDDDFTIELKLFHSLGSIRA